MIAERIYKGMNPEKTWDLAIFKVREGLYYLTWENPKKSFKGLADSEFLSVEELEISWENSNINNLIVFKGDEKIILDELLYNMDDFPFRDVNWGDLDLSNNEIMSSTEACEEWGIDSSTLRKRIGDFPEGTIRKISTTYAVTKFGMRCVFGSKK